MVAKSRILVCNPQSGDGIRTHEARALALERDFEVLDSEGSDHTVELAAEAADRGEVIVACGGDGTLNDMVRGVREAGRIDDVSLGVIPAGTNFTLLAAIRQRYPRHLAGFYRGQNVTIPVGMVLLTVIVRRDVDRFGHVLHINNSTYIELSSGVSNLTNRLRLSRVQILHVGVKWL